MKKTILYLLLGIYMGTIGCSGKEGTDNAQLDADVSPIIPKINSTVTEVRVSDNQVVKKGDTLVLLDKANYVIAVDQAEIGLALAKTNVNLAGYSNNAASVGVSGQLAGSGAVRAGLAGAEAGIEAAKARYGVAVKNYERFDALLKQNSATQQQFDGVSAEKIAAKAQLDAAISQRNALIQQIDASRMQILNAKTQVKSAKDGIDLAELNVKEAQSGLDAAKLQLSYCTITSPLDGVVSKKNVQIGQVVAPGQPLMAVANNKNVWVIANFKETQLEKMRVGQEAEIKVDAYSDTTFKGKVQSFSQATGSKFSFLPVDNATGNFVKVTQRIPVKILFDGVLTEKYPLRAGMNVYVDVKTR